MYYSALWLQKHLSPVKPYSSLVVSHIAAIAQLGERQTEDLKVAVSIPACGASVNTHN